MPDEDEEADGVETETLRLADMMNRLQGAKATDQESPDSPGGFTKPGPAAAPPNRRGSNQGMGEQNVRPRHCDSSGSVIGCNGVLTCCVCVCRASWRRSSRGNASRCTAGG
jgi:hypothetical protein